MSPDEYQTAWQSQSERTRVMVDADSLMEAVQRNRQQMRAVVSFNDFGEVGVLLLLLPMWIILGITTASPWMWYLMVPVLIWGAAFKLGVRARRKPRPIDTGEPLVSGVKESLALVEHQIWLQRKVFWYSQLPMAIAMLAFFFQVAWQSAFETGGWFAGLFMASISFVFVVAIFSFIYHVNQRVIRTQHEPRRQELLSLLTNLSDETSSDVSGEYPILMRGTVCVPSRRRMIAGCLGAVVLFSIGIGTIILLSNLVEGYQTRSPFAAVRWEEAQPEVQVEGEWYKLTALNEIPVNEIVAFSKRTYGDLWQKRFEEDLVELLARMGHPPGGTVTLEVQSLTSAETRTLEDVPMTRANRDAIRDAAQTRERSDEQQGMRPAVPIDDRELFQIRIDEFLSAARTKAGFSGAVIVARGGEPVYQGAFGFSHLDSQAANTIDTPFRIASLSKQFTAAAIFHLEAQGKLSIDDPVHQYLTEFAKDSYRDITIHHLLTHTSGLPRSPEGFVGSSRWNAMSKRATPVDDYVRLAVKTPLEFEPGADFQYSNFGYRILAALISRVTGKEFADFMEEEIFRPLDMPNSGVARITQPPSEARIAEGLVLRKLPFASEARFYNGEWGRNFGAGYGSGGIYASANDLLRWDRVLAGDAFLSREQKERLFRPVRGNYACGWIVKVSGLDGRLYQMHNGGNEGFFSQMMRIPEDDLVIIAVGNVEATPEIDEVLEQLFRLCRSLPYREL